MQCTVRYVMSDSGLSKKEAAFDEECSRDKGIDSTFCWTFSTNLTFSCGSPRLLKNWLKDVCTVFFFIVHNAITLEGITDACCYF